MPKRLSLANCLIPGRIYRRCLTPRRWRSVALLYPATTRQRVGFLLEEMSEHVGRDFDLDPLEATLPMRDTDRRVRIQPRPQRAAHQT